MRRLASIAALCAVVSSSGAAGAYEFEVRALTIGQGYDLRAFRPLTGDVLVARRRFTQTLSLDIWDISGRRSGPGHTLRLRDSTPPPRGPEYYFTSYLRIDHDFGEYTAGEISIGSLSHDAVDLIPELEASSLRLDVLFAYAGVKGLAGGAVDLELGRQLVVDTLDWWSFDGLTARWHTPWRFAVEGFGGLRVRDSSYLGSYVQEPDGSSSAECAEYVEDEVPGTGSWRPIDRQEVVGTNPFTNDFDLCPQRDELMPTFGGSIETEGLPVHARVSYRRSQSRTPGLIGAPDRLEYEDTGLYPDETGKAPPWGVNEERVAASVRYTYRGRRGKLRVTPFAALRYSLLHGVIDQEHAGVNLRWGAHTLSPEYYSSFPTFDGDSIFNVFSVAAYRDVRATYELHPAGSRLAGYARGWVRSYTAEDGDASMVADERALAGGGQVGARYKPGPYSFARLDVFHEDGYGGRRTGGFGSLRWRLNEELDVAGRVSVIDFDEDALVNLHGTTFGAQVGGTYRINQGIALHVVVEDNTNRFYENQLRAIAILDLAHNPEP